MTDRLPGPGDATDVFWPVHDLDPDADADQETSAHYRSVGHALQDACDVVLAAGLGSDRDAITRRLREELELRGHWPQPSPWLEAVVEEIQMGHGYRVIAT